MTSLTIKFSDDQTAIIGITVDQNDVLLSKPLIITELPHHQRGNEMAIMQMLTAHTEFCDLVVSNGGPDIRQAKVVYEEPRALFNMIIPMDDIPFSDGSSRKRKGGLGRRWPSVRGV